MTSTAAARASDIATEELRRIPLEQLHDSPLNPRKHYDPAKIDELADSLLSSGQLTPAIARPMKKGEGYELAAGHRRRRAAMRAIEKSVDGATYRGLSQLLVIVREMDDKEFVEVLTIENMQRDNLHPLEEANGFADLIKVARYDVRKIASRIGKSERYVYDLLKIHHELIPAAKKLFADDVFSLGHAVILSRLTTEQQKQALGEVEEAAAGDSRASLLFQHQGGEGNEELSLSDQVKAVSVREFQQAINRHIRAAAEDIDPFLFPESAAALEAAKDEKLPVIHITRDHLVHDDAKDEKVRTYGAPSWYRADGQLKTDRFGETEKTKTCDWSRYGLVVAGPGRGEVFKVCINREKCKVHWPEQVTAAERRKKAVKKDVKAGGGTANQEKEAEREKAATAKWEAEVKVARERGARWRKAGPALVKALVEAVEKLPVKIKGSTLIKHFSAQQWNKEAQRLQGLVPTGAPLLTRIVAYQLLEDVSEYEIEDDLTEAFRFVGFSPKQVEAVVDEAVPAPKTEKPEGNIVLKKKGTKPKVKKAKKAKGK